MNGRIGLVVGLAVGVLLCGMAWLTFELKTFEARIVKLEAAMAPPDPPPPETVVQERRVIVIPRYVRPKMPGPPPFSQFNPGPEPDPPPVDPFDDKGDEPNEPTIPSA